MIDNEKIRLALWFSIEAELRYLSHRETLTLWQRALVRAQLPVRYSQGFNPHMKLSLPLPRSVSVSASRELLVVELDERLAIDEILLRLREQLPDGISLNEGAYIAGKASLQPVSSRIAVSLKPTVQLAALQNQVAQFDQAERKVVRPARGRHPHREFDLRDCVEQLELNNETLYFTLPFSQQGSARIDEVLGALAVDSGTMVSEIKRLEVNYPVERKSVH